MNERSTLGRFIMVCRKFGVGTAARVTYSKIRGKLLPALALPPAPPLDMTRRELTILFTTAGQSAKALDAIVGFLGKRRNANWELCICERTPAEPAMAEAVERCRGKYPWIRVVSTDRSVDEQTAARWTVEQATGEFIAVLANGSTPWSGAVGTDAIAGDAMGIDALGRLVHRLRCDPVIDAAALVARDVPAGELPWAGCRLLVQRKASYLRYPPADWLVPAPVHARLLEAAGVIVAFEQTMPPP